jgi:hypothetical protein
MVRDACATLDAEGAVGSCVVQNLRHPKLAIQQGFFYYNLILLLLSVLRGRVKDFRIKPSYERACSARRVRVEWMTERTTAYFSRFSSSIFCIQSYGNSLLLIESASTFSLDVFSCLFSEEVIVFRTLKIVKIMAPFLHLDSDTHRAV